MLAAWIMVLTSLSSSRARRGPCCCRPRLPRSATAPWR